MTTVKIFYNNDVRRFLLESVSFKDLQARVAELFKLPLEGFCLKYKDEDGDAVTITTDMELQEAVKMVKNNTPLKMFVETPQTKGKSGEDNFVSCSNLLL